MKKMVRLMVVFVILTMALPSCVYANSTPSYWQGYPSANVLCIDKETPISIINEDLTYDFRLVRQNSHSLKARVIADYTMVNTATEDLKVQMAFPFINDINDISQNDIKVYIDDVEIDYRLYLNESVENEVNTYLDVDNIAADITDREFKSEYVNDKKDAKLYVFTKNSDKELEVYFKIDGTKSKVVPIGFNSGSVSSHDLKLGTRADANTRVALLVIGKDVDIKIVSGKASIKTENISPKSFIQRYLLPNSQEYYRKLAPNQIYNITAKRLDALLKTSGVVWHEDITSVSHYDRVNTIVYGVDFKSNDTKKVRVEYTNFGTMDKRSSMYATHKFTYLLTPAKYWKEFKSLNINVIPINDVPYMVQSNMEFELDDAGIYTVSFDELPDNELEFVMYKDKILKPQKNLTDGVASETNYLMYGLGIGIALLILICIRIIRRWSKKLNI